MKIVLRESTNGVMREVFNDNFMPSDPNDIDKLTREAFDFALINYIIKQFPMGCGVRTERRILQNGDVDVYCYCSGRNVRCTVENDAVHVDDCSQNDREYQLSILKA